MIEQEAHVRTEIAWMRANLSAQAFADWCRSQQEQPRNWLDDFEHELVTNRLERPGEI